MIKTWTYGLNEFKKCSLEINEGQPNKFKTTIHEEVIDTKTPVDELLRQHINSHRKIEILFSGGLDSELALHVCRKFNLPVVAKTLVLKSKDMILNTHDLYYAEKYCREHNIQQDLIVLHIEKFFDNGKFLDYLKPYYISEPHVASHFWLIEQCDSFPVMGGDWHWVQKHKYILNPVLSPIRLDYSCYDTFMADSGITGVGNMMGYSYNAVYRFIKLHVENYLENSHVSEVKVNMFNHIFDFEPRLRSYGFERIPKTYFDIEACKKECVNLFGETTHEIIWGQQVADLIETTVYRNDKF